MKTYMIGIWFHISADIIIYWPIYENTIILYDISTDICLNLENKNFHISLKKWKISAYIDQNIIFEKNHISVNIPLSYIGQYIIFNIDRYMLTYSGRIYFFIYRFIFWKKKSYIGQYIVFNIDWYMHTYSGPNSGDQNLFMDQ